MNIMTTIEIEKLGSRFYTYEFYEYSKDETGIKFILNFNFKASFNYTPILAVSFNADATQDCTFRPKPEIVSIELNNYLYITSEMKQISEFVS